MRKLLFTLIILLTVAGYAQQVKYRIIESDPELAYTKFVAPEYGVMSTSTTLAAYLGAQARVGITNAMVLEGYGRYDVWSLSGKGPQFVLDAAAFLPLKNKTKTKDIPVILSYNPYAGTEYKNGKRYNIEETRSITIKNGTYHNQLGVRGGVHIASVGTAAPALGPEGVVSHAGVYLGGQLTSKALIKTLINDDVYRYGAGFSRFYADLMVLPVNNLSEPQATDGTKEDGLIGWRGGFQWYVSPHDGDYRFLGRSVFTVEVGQRPVSGWLFSFGWGFAFAEKR